MTLAFQQIQHKFVSSVRSGVPIKGDHELYRRVGIYQSLLFNNILNFVDSGFPVLKSIIDNKKWRELVRDFFQTWECKSPYFIAISEAFLNYLIELDLEKHQLPIFTVSLAHYEWLELAISIRDVEVRFAKSNEKVSSVKLSPLATLVSYPFPVHQISSMNQPRKSSELHYYVVYRDKSCDVQFSKLAPATAYVLQILIESETGTSLQSLKNKAIKAMPSVDPATIAAGMELTIADMLEKGILLPV
ncbi:HvfC family RiPP maturation protein [Alteromonas sp. ASW11-130]|uniref:HvfC family RiPP maturation protein n=1 Tax=Alteromonas sp. ASW11-130 TaxID=3015775 RepID=UPI0022424242|nr:putative DNA-binding domain-containing protein [Alteromonas sp. ASW11-130]MCW8092505.1 putative DNA-binding domain-containing protein [Alteromonas sp. ASW11-130]